MIIYKKCPICNSQDLRGYAIDVVRKGPHISRVQCKSCKLVFANPMADKDELDTYYNQYYEKDHYEAMDYKSLIISHFERIKSLTHATIKRETRYLRDLNPGDKFLDIGCGLGLGLAYANRLGCELFATELDKGALDFVSNHFQVKTFQGEVWEARFPDEFFDFIHISHVIEHVLHPREYIQEMKRIIKPGGIIAIGTPDISSNLYKIYRWSNFLRFNVPDVIDGLEHTFIFPKSVLSKLCLEEGLIIKDHYTHSIGEKITNLLKYKISFTKKINRLIQNFFNVNQWIICKRNN
ncbi:2-polyprenyl-3-methyl-5-hydroxy-6-metoxy-1,4-benzoquinol methylase [Algoriphagus faecimaris]|uniref:2-polyprenyl-3-methyl-5-hydroxy-6-metoxy-1,4-benzoquinol methylase n=1 Tax=Algoriphagus faecimaris TaxID=686796 RepID=A0A1G6UT62_9BACT|nr:class I SAM-dependent methyltransferase [Algoriphagus faecimaris]SDD44483.1 2-polyprenyl-3-methyl-5-hydroxy-6-metoxy-1,4-benzoquinol methylase [Algoriphagus faecimaris]